MGRSSLHFAAFPKESRIYADCGVAPGLGIGANTAISNVVNGVLLRLLPYPEPGRVMIVYESSQDFGRSSIAYPSFLDWRRPLKTLELELEYAGMATTERYLYVSECMRRDVIAAHNGFVNRLFEEWSMRRAGTGRLNPVGGEGMALPTFEPPTRLLSTHLRPGRKAFTVRLTFLSSRPEQGKQAVVYDLGFRLTRRLALGRRGKR